MGNLINKNIMDVKGGGLTHYELGNMKYMRLCYGEGLRVPKMQNRAWDREKYFYQKSGYCRGYIWHHRSNATQQSFPFLIWWSWQVLHPKICYGLRCQNLGKNRLFPIRIPHYWIIHWTKRV